MLDSAPSDILQLHLEHWAAARTSCAPADRTSAEEGIRLAYRAAGLAPPGRIVWCGSPVEIAKQIAGVSAADRLGCNVKELIYTEPRDKVVLFAEIFWKEIVIAVTEAASGLSSNRSINAASRSFERSELVGSGIHRVVQAAASEVLDRLCVRSRHLVQRCFGLPRMLPTAAFSEIAVAPDELSTLSVYDYLNEVVGCTDQWAPLRGLWMIARSAGWIVPHEHVCWISERPELIRTDASGRLHCTTGPALRYRDGWSVHAWKGVPVPQWAIDEPERITPKTIEGASDPKVRRAMIDIMSPERFIATGDATCVAKDDSGALWFKYWPRPGARPDTWSAVEVENGTTEADGSRRRYALCVPPQFCTAREAVAWTYGLTADQYADLNLRT